MIESQNIKTVPLIGPVTIATNADTTARFEWGIFNAARVEIRLNPATATNSSHKALVCKLEEADDTTTSVSAITIVNQSTSVAGFSGTTNSVAVSTSGEFVLPVHNDTAEAQVINLHIYKNAGRKRYVRLSLRGPTNFNTVFAQAVLSRPEVGIDSASDAGEDARVVG